LSIGSAGLYKNGGIGGIGFSTGRWAPFAKISGRFPHGCRKWKWNCGWRWGIPHWALGRVGVAGRQGQPEKGVVLLWCGVLCPAAFVRPATKESHWQHLPTPSSRHTERKNGCHS